MRVSLDSVELFVTDINGALDEATRLEKQSLIQALVRSFSGEDFMERANAALFEQELEGLEIDQLRELTPCLGSFFDFFSIDSNRDRVVLLRAFVNTSIADCRSVALQVMQLASRQATANQLTHFIAALMTISNLDKRQHVVGVASFLIYPDMSSMSRVHLIETLSLFNEELRNKLHRVKLGDKNSLAELLATLGKKDPKIDVLEVVQKLLSFHMGIN